MPPGSEVRKRTVASDAVDLLSRLSNPGAALALMAVSSAENTAEQPFNSLPGRPRQHQRRLTPAEVDELVAARAAGATMAQLADQFDIKRQTVSRWLKRRGIA